MKSYKDIVQQLQETAATSQNSTAEVSMTEDHLVHVSDGSKYDEVPHKKDIEHVKTGAMHTGGEWAGHSDKGAFFKFKSKEDAEHFKRHVDKCPHRTCYADHVNEAVEYKGIGTDVVNKKKKLNPQPNFTTDKKQVKDFKEEAEQIDELDKKTIGSYAKKATKDLKWQQTMRPFDAKRISNREKGIDRAIDKLTKEEVEQVDESSLHRQHFQMVADLIRGHESAEKRKELAHHHAELFKKANPRFDHAKFMKASGVNEEVELEEGKVYDPFTKKMVATKPIKVQAGGGATRNGVPVETGPSKYKNKLPMSKAAGVLAAEEVELIDELSKDTLASYAKKASHDARIKQHVAADFKSKEAHARNPRKKETWGSIAKKYQSQAWKREDGHDKAVDKLAGTKTKPSRPGDIYGKSFTEETQIDELSKGLVARYANKAAKTTQANYDKSKDKFQFSSGRQDGMKNAVKRLTKEEVQIDELSYGTKHSYNQHAFKDVINKVKDRKTLEKHISGDDEHPLDEPRANRIAQSLWKNKAAKKHMEHSKDHEGAVDYLRYKIKQRNAGIEKTNEEVQIDEISKSTLMRYIPKASRDVGSHTYAGKEAGEWANHYTRAGDWSAAEKHSKKSYADFKKANKRIAGIDTATKKLGTQKEEVELDEAIAKKLPVQHAVDAVHATLGPKSATRFLSHLSPGSDKHTSWDKVNDALVKQGVQTRHIASIAQKTSRMNEEVNEDVWSSGYSYRWYTGVDGKLYRRKYHKKIKDKDSNLKPYRGGSVKADVKEETITEDQYTSEFKIKSYVDPITGENKTRKIRPHRVTFRASEMGAKPAQTNDIKESRGHKVLATFFKNREVAQRAYQGNPAHDSTVAAGGGTPADQGIAAAKADYKKMNNGPNSIIDRNKHINDLADKLKKPKDWASAMNAESVEEGFDNYPEIAKELVKKHGKNVTAQHVKDFAGQRDSNKGLDHAEVMHHVKKLSEDDKVYDEKWKKFTKGAK